MLHTGGSSTLCVLAFRGDFALTGKESRATASSETGEGSRGGRGASFLSILSEDLLRK